MGRSVLEGVLSALVDMPGWQKSILQGYCLDTKKQCSACTAGVQSGQSCQGLHFGSHDVLSCIMHYTEQKFLRK